LPWSRRKSQSGSLIGSRVKSFGRELGRPSYKRFDSDRLDRKGWGKKPETSSDEKIKKETHRRKIGGQSAREGLFTERDGMGETKNVNLR